VSFRSERLFKPNTVYQFEQEIFVSKNKLFRKAAIAAIIAGPLTAAMATNGYFSHGYGIVAKSMGGAAIAMASDAMSWAIT
jgi:long-chain fatty acid transport protein